LLIAEGHNVAEVARQAGHSPKMALDAYAHVFEEFDPAERLNAADRIRKARDELRFRARQPTLFDSGPAGYAAVHRYDGAVIELGQRERTIHCAVQSRDLAIVRDIWRYHFVTTDQLLELWWPGASAQAGRRRLVKLFRAGYLDRFRPISRRGSYPWTYHLGADGHRMLVQSGAIPRTDRFKARAIYEYGHVLHDLQLNSWVLAWRRLLGDALLE
jgi:hypothetical protein